MKTIIKLKVIGLLLILISSFSCSNSDDPEGKWDDNIKLSQKEAKFSVEGDLIVITTKGEWWWLESISLNEISDFDLTGIDITAKDFVIDETEFRIERKNTTEIHIEMTKNMTGSERVLIIGLEAGDYFDRIKITQSAN
ncbi:MAG: hypothetical protein WC389_06730 [Lutibacter sp.]|jgi:hypothetical protein